MNKFAQFVIDHPILTSVLWGILVLAIYAALFVGAVMVVKALLFT